MENMLQRLALIGLVLIVGHNCCLADLNENGFEAYNEGESVGFGWRAQFFSEADDGYIEATDRIRVKRDAATGNQTIVWNAGVGGKQQTRTLKEFAPTTALKAVVSFNFKPGSETLERGLGFEQAGVCGISLSFTGGTLRITEDKAPTDTGIEFKAENWNHIRLLMDFEKHTVEVWLNHASAGIFQLPVEFTALNQLNFSCGGVTFESEIDDLVVESVEEFPKDMPDEKQAPLSEAK